MIDLWYVASHALWIFGLAVLLAAWSFGYYEAQQVGEPVLTFLTQPNYALAITLGLVLFFAGLAATDVRPWARVVWGVMGVAAIAFLIYRRKTT
jgi:hypothetical protein